jgi:anti-sigma factor RsiW
VEIGELLVFAPALAATLHRLPEDQLRRLSVLMDAHADGELDPNELRELEALVAEADEIDFANAQRLVEHRDRVREAGLSHAPSAAD